MLNSSQIFAVLIGVVVFLGLIVPGYSRYAFLGGAVIIVVNIALFGAVGEVLPYLLR